MRTQTKGTSMMTTVREIIVMFAFDFDIDKIKAHLIYSGITPPRNRQARAYLFTRIILS